MQTQEQESCLLTVRNVTLIEPHARTTQLQHVSHAEIQMLSHQRLVAEHVVMGSTTITMELLLLTVKHVTELAQLVLVPSLHLEQVVQMVSQQLIILDLEFVQQTTTTSTSDLCHLPVNNDI